ncbi:hypothetical protein OAH87_01495 [Marinomonas sp.]|nr:hypothetical protein [Marinomonas sp.]MDB4837120.1 hypothetical protein [Marinomonas sp.]
MRCLKGHTSAVFFLLLVWPCFASSSEEPLYDEKTEELELAWWQRSHQRASQAIGHWSNNMDAFFSGRPSDLSSESDSQVKVRLGSILEADSTSGLFDLRVKWKLPNTKERLQLVLDSDGDTLVPESISGESSQQKNAVESALKTNVSAAVRFAEEGTRADFDVGILIDFPLDPFVRLRFKQERIEEHWYWYQKEEVFAYYSEGVGARYGLGGGHQLTSTLQYGADMSLVWLDKEGLFYARESLFLQHDINERSQLRYDISFLQSGESKLKSDTVLYSLEYNRFLYDNWLSAQVKPQITHEAEDDYKGEWSLTLSLVALIGTEYLH